MDPSIFPLAPRDEVTLGEGLMKTERTLKNTSSWGVSESQVDLLYFTQLTPTLDGFRSHRAYVGQLLTYIRYGLFKILTWVNQPFKQVQVAQSFEILRAHEEIALLRDRLEKLESAWASHAS